MLVGTYRFPSLTVFYWVCVLVCDGFNQDDLLLPQQTLDRRQEHTPEMSYTSFTALSGKGVDIKLGYLQ